MLPELIMAVPKKRTSVSRKGKRRAGQHHKMTPKISSKCSNCGATSMRHTVCSSCGTYKGREVIVLKEKNEAEQEA